LRAAVSGICLPLILVAGCSLYRTTASLDLVEMGPEQVLQQASDRAGTVSSLLTTGTIQIQSARGAYTARVMVMYAAPDSIRLDVSVALGGVVAQAVITGEDVLIYFTADRIALEGDLAADQYLDFQGITLERALITELIMGPAHTWNWVDLAARLDQFDVGPNQVTMGLNQPGGTRFILSMGPELDYWKTVRLDSRGSIIFETYYSNYRRFGGARLPQKVTVFYPRERFELVFEVVSRRDASDHTPDDFTIRIPTGVERLPLYNTIPPPSYR
jgi:hypothetical protein